MFLRMVSMGIRAEHSQKIAQEYERNVVSALRHQPGCRFASLLQNTADHKDCISLTIWESKSSTLEYESSGVFKKLVESLRAYYEESTEFELKLTDDLAIEYTPVQLDPSVQSFDDADTGKEYIRVLGVTPYAANIMTVTVQPEKILEFQEIFAAKVIPKFTGQKGFIHIILLRKSNEFNIISLWDETVDLTAVGEQSLQGLARSIYSMLPSSVRWQVSHKSVRPTSVSTEEMHTGVYRCLTGEWFSR